MNRALKFYKNHEYTIFQYIINSLGLFGFFFAVFKGEWFLLLVSFLLHIVYKLFANNIALHRYFAHKSFKTSPTKHKFLCWISILMGAGSPVLFASAHRHHHRYADTEKDLHGPTQGYLKTIYWDLIPSNTSKVKQFALDVYKDSTASLVHKWYYVIWYTALIGTFLIHPYITIFGLLLPHVIYRWHAGTIVNIFTHMSLKSNYITYETKDNSMNNKVLGAWALGEAYHNNHHGKPNEYNFAHNRGEFDLTAWFIRKVFL